MSRAGERRPCPGCGVGSLAPFFDMPPVPVHCNVTSPTAAEALAMPTGRLRLGICSECALIHNLDFDPALLRYSPDYETSLHYSPRFQQYAADLAGRLAQRHGLRGRDVVEIGCGKGEFLSLLAQRGARRCTGFDQSYEGAPDGGAPANVEIHRSWYEAAAFPEVRADLLVCRHVLEHVADPAGFLAAVAPAVRPDGAAYFEVPDALYTLRDLGIWDLIYEHCSYFVAPAIARLFERQGLAADELESTFGGQFLGVHARPRRGGRAAGVPVSVAEVAQLARRFADAFARKLAHWSDDLSARLSSGRTLAVWGCGSKGVTFLNLVAGGNGVQLAVDLNRRKQGRHVPGTGQRIVPPEALAGRPIDDVYVMNPVYRDEIAASLAGLGLHPDLHLV